MSNRLAQETSPYLLQHANNPVDWYPWGPEALERAKREDKPILLSIGYAACHWCHVMERESFEDSAMAVLMNERFVNIKVDREERPDLDVIYMQAVQAMTGHGGWPMTMILTPEGAPFFGGTYFPPEDRQGMPSFRRVLLAVSDAYQTRRSDVARTAASMQEIYEAATDRTGQTGSLTAQLLERAFRALEQRYDADHGGFEGAPKFPQPMALDFVLRYWGHSGANAALDMVSHSFRRMARGGIYDQVGGGFARYTVDAIWLVPHFEKMLYDNAQLALLGVHLWQATHDAEVRRVTEETIDWAIREMRHPDGGFFSSLDADSEGHEGKFYLWTARELDEVLRDDAPIARAYWGVTPEGNFEGESILHVPGDTRAVARGVGVSEERLDAVIARARSDLYDARARRVWPGRDEKVLASWNGLMLRAIAHAARVFGSARYRDVAVTCGEFLFREMVRDGRVLRSYTGGRARIAGYLEDHAALGLAALSLYELTFDSVWLDRAHEMADVAVRWFWSDDAGTFFDTAADHEILITRPRDITDNAVPSGTSLATDLLTRLAEVLGNDDLRRRAMQVAEALAEPMARHPAAFGHLLGATDMLVHGAVGLALVGDPAAVDFQALARVAARTYVPSEVLAGGAPVDGSGIALLAGRTLRDGLATAYLCRDFACREPVTSPDALQRQLMELRGGRV